MHMTAIKMTHIGLYLTTWGRNLQLYYFHGKLGKRGHVVPIWLWILKFLFTQLTASGQVFAKFCRSTSQRPESFMGKRVRGWLMPLTQPHRCRLHGLAAN